MRGFWLYIYSERNLYGCLFALSGLALYFVGIIKDYWFLIIPGLYLVGMMLNPPSKSDLELKANLADADIKNALDQMINKAKRRLPPEAVAHCERIKTLVVDMLPRIRTAQGTQDAFAIKQAALDYLPHTLENYLALPPAYANIHPIKDGKTAKVILLEQLTLLEQSVQEASSNVLQGDAQKILVNSRFLEDKFAKPEEFFKTN
jgi:hypothetical protein